MVVNACLLWKENNVKMKLYVVSLLALLSLNVCVLAFNEASLSTLTQQRQVSYDAGVFGPPAKASLPPLLPATHNSNNEAKS